MAAEITNTNQLKYLMELFKFKSNYQIKNRGNLLSHWMLLLKRFWSAIKPTPLFSHQRLRFMVTRIN